jgi:hypothetical protein
MLLQVYKYFTTRILAVYSIECNMLAPLSADVINKQLKKASKDIVASTKLMIDLLYNSSKYQ